MREDIKKLLRQDGLLLWGRARRQAEKLSSMLDENESVILVLRGQLEAYHGAVPLPERLDGFLCVTDKGVRLYGNLWKTVVRYRKSWQQLDRFDTSSGKFFELQIALKDGNSRYVFREGYRGKISEHHKQELEQVKQRYFYRDEE